MGRISALCRACSHVALHSSRASCPIPRWTSPTQQPWSKHPGRQQKNARPFQCIFGPTDSICQPAGSTRCSRERDFLLPAALPRAEVLLEVRRALWGEAVGELDASGCGAACSAWLGTAWLPATSDSVLYFWSSKGRKIRDTNLHTPLRRTIKRAEDILERLQILLCPALSTAGCLQNMLRVLLAYAPVLICSMTLMSYHRAMTQFKQNFQKSEPAAPLCHLPLLTFVPALLRSLTAGDTTLWGFLTSPLTAELSTIKWQSQQIWRGPRGTSWQQPHRETCLLFPSLTRSRAATLSLLWLFLVRSLF